VRLWALTFTMCLSIGLGSCAQPLMPRVVTTNMPVPDGWHDGSYTGVSDRSSDVPTPQLVRASVDISGGRVVTIRVYQAPGFGPPPAPELLLGRVLEQSTMEVDTAPVGNESRQLMRALDDAISRARLSSPPSQ